MVSQLLIMYTHTPTCTWRSDLRVGVWDVVRVICGVLPLPSTLEGLLLGGSTSEPSQPLLNCLGIRWCRQPVPRDASGAAPGRGRGRCCGSSWWRHGGFQKLFHRYVDFRPWTTERPCLQPWPLISQLLRRNLLVSLSPGVSWFPEV